MPGRDTCPGWPAAIGALVLFACSGAAMAAGCSAATGCFGDPSSVASGDGDGRLFRASDSDRSALVARVARVFFWSKRPFTEGQDVKTGDLLFRSNADQFQAAVEQSAGRVRQGRGDRSTPRGARRAAKISSATDDRALDRRPARRGQRRGGQGVADAGPPEAGRGQSRLHRHPLADRRPHRPHRLYARQSGQPGERPSRRSSARTRSTCSSRSACASSRLQTQVAEDTDKIEHLVFASAATAVLIPSAASGT